MRRAGACRCPCDSGRQYTLFHLLRDIPESWRPFEAEGTIFGSINKPQLHAVEIPGIRVGIEKALEDQLRTLEERIIAALIENVCLAELRDALLPELMSDRLRVQDPGQDVREVV